ncbi:Lysophospholipase L1 [Pedobacter rhizosphaerae]|uniref:Lysophospholipase L1 n=2 Tax=Pedobacter rhizosphaerae TaxID=390241 RepID=A0A1H9LP74_9SPHI|nr:Lysophospholipase L1 [Pedobacter rhizosphaerae]
MKLLISLLLSFLIPSCTKTQYMPDTSVSEKNMPASIKQSQTYLALGDSYTIGEAVETSASFPYQLQQLLNEKGLNVSSPRIIATTGWTTDELQEAINKSQIDPKYDFVTLLIGVNNQYRGYPLAQYKKEFESLLNQAITFAQGDKTRVFVISFPDWGATPFGQQSGRNLETTAAEVDAFNAANREISNQAGVSYTDITPESRNARVDAGLVATDGLHPSEKMYAAWAQAICPKVFSRLK